MKGNVCKILLTVCNSSIDFNRYGAWENSLHPLAGGKFKFHDIRLSDCPAHFCEKRHFQEYLHGTLKISLDVDYLLLPHLCL